MQKTIQCLIHWTIIIKGKETTKIIQKIHVFVGQRNIEFSFSINSKHYMRHLFSYVTIGIAGNAMTFDMTIF